MKNLILRSRASILLALIVVILPFLSLPEILQDSLLVVVGLLIALLGFAKSHYVSNLDLEDRNLNKDKDIESQTPSENFSDSLDNQTGVSYE